MTRSSLSIVVISTVSGCSLLACSLGALDGFAGTPAVDAGGEASSTDGASSEASVEASSSSSGSTSSSSGSSGTSGGCTQGATNDSVCSHFDNGGAPDEGWTSSAGTGTYGLVPTGRSAPNALQLSFPNTGTTSESRVGPHFTKVFGGPWSKIECVMAIALDELPEDGGVDVISFGSDPDDIAVRVFHDQIRLTSCRNSSDCINEISSGVPPTLGQFHEYKVDWVASTGKFTFSIDGSFRSEVSTKTPPGTPTIADIRVGLNYRPYGEGGTWRARFDDVSCVRTP